MKKLSTALLAQVVSTKRKELKLTQQELADKTGFNRAQLSRLEQEDYYPLIPQLEALGDVLGFELDDVHHFQSGVFKCELFAKLTLIPENGLFS